MLVLVTKLTNQMNKPLLLFQLFLSLLLLSCTGQKKERRNIICLIDYSGTISKDVLNCYATIISKDVFLTLGPSDKFVLMPIDEGAKIQDTNLDYLDLKDLKFEKQSDGVTHKLDSIKHRLLNYFSERSDTIYKNILQQKELRRKFTNYTDIINALEQIPSKLERNETVSTMAGIWNEVSGSTTFLTSNVLVICSDMIHESLEFNFNKKPTITQADADHILQQLGNANRIPNLEGLKVFINGRTGRNNNQIDNIKYFWENYFKAAKAEIKAYDYDIHNLIKEYLNVSHK